MSANKQIKSITRSSPSPIGEVFSFSKDIVAVVLIDDDDLAVTFLGQGRNFAIPFGGGPQIDVEGLLGALGNEADKRPDVAFVGLLEELVVFESIVFADDNGRVAGLHQD